MDKGLLNKLILNALKALNQRLSYDGCNDLSKDDPLLNNISKEELELIRLEWVKLFPEESKEMDYKLNFNHELVNMLEKKLEE